MQGCVHGANAVLNRQQVKLLVSMLTISLSCSPALVQFALPANPEKAYFLKPEERAWLADRQRREQEIRAQHNSKSGGTLREPLLSLMTPTARSHPPQCWLEGSAPRFVVM